jgi:hypothetical protein
MMARRSMAARVRVGQRWRRRRDRAEARVRQVHRADRLAELEFVAPEALAGRRESVGFTALRTKWLELEQVQ